MAHYVGVFVPLETGGWRARFPDIPNCQVDGTSLDLTIFQAANALAEIKQRNSAAIPPPRNLVEIKEDESWASACNVDWHTCVVTMIPMRG